MTRFEQRAEQEWEYARTVLGPLRLSWCVLKLLVRKRGFTLDEFRAAVKAEAGIA